MAKLLKIILSEINYHSYGFQALFFSSVNSDGICSLQAGQASDLARLLGGEGLRYDTPGINVFFQFYCHAVE
jgi:hypothetical protein